MTASPYINRTTPHARESIDSLVARLGRWNYQSTVRWVYEDVLGPREVTTQPLSASLNLHMTPQLVSRVARLGQLTTEEVSATSALSWAPLFGVSQDQLMTRGPADRHNQTLSRWLHTSSTKVCGACLGEGEEEPNPLKTAPKDGDFRPRYHRRVWDIVLVTACLEHGRLLVDRCPHTDNPQRPRIRVARLYPDLCTCGGRLNATSGQLLDEPGRAMQEAVHAALGQTPASRMQPSLAGPELIQGIETLWQLVWHAEPGSDDSRRDKRPKYSNNERRHAQLTHAFQALSGDQSVITDTIRLLRGRGMAQGTTGTEQEFGLLKRFIRRNCSIPALGPFVEQFERYLRHEWDGGYVGMVAGVTGRRGDASERFCSLQETLEILACSFATVKEALNRGELAAAVTKSQGGRHLYLFERTEVARYLILLRQCPTVEEVAEKLGVDRKRVELLAAEGLLVALTPGKPRRYQVQEVEQLDACVRALLPLTNVLRLILDGSLPARRTPGGKGLLAIQVSEEDIARLSAARREARHTERGATPQVIARQVGYGSRSLERWARAGLIEATQTPGGQPRITLGAVEAFRQIYMTADEVHAHLGITRVALYKLVQDGRLVPAFAPAMSRALLLFRREDVEGLRNSEAQPIQAPNESAA